MLYMRKLTSKELSQYVTGSIKSFHQQRIQSIDSIDLSKVLKRKNPYLFKAKNILTADKFIKGLVDAHISSNEETVFGTWMEGLIFVNNVYGAQVGY